MGQVFMRDEVLDKLIQIDNKFVNYQIKVNTIQYDIKQMKEYLENNDKILVELRAGMGAILQFLADKKGDINDSD